MPSAPNQGLAGVDPDGRGTPRSAALVVARQQYPPPGHYLHQFTVKRRSIEMLWIILLALIVIGALAVLSLALHMLFSPWLLLLAVGLLLWLKFRPRRYRR
jgi:hypothetical protein